MRSAGRPKACDRMARFRLRHSSHWTSSALSILVWMNEIWPVIFLSSLRNLISSR